MYKPRDYYPVHFMISPTDAIMMMPVIRIYNPLILQSPRSSPDSSPIIPQTPVHILLPFSNLFFTFSSWAVVADLLATVLAVPRPAHVATSVTARDAEYVISPMMFQVHRLTRHA